MNKNRVFNCVSCGITVTTPEEIGGDKCSVCDEHLVFIEKDIQKALNVCRVGGVFNSSKWVELNDEICLRYSLTKAQWGQIRAHMMETENTVN